MGWTHGENEREENAEKIERQRKKNWREMADNREQWTKAADSGVMNDVQQLQKGNERKNKYQHNKLSTLMRAFTKWPGNEVTFCISFFLYFYVKRFELRTALYNFFFLLLIFTWTYVCVTLSCGQTCRSRP